MTELDKQLISVEEKLRQLVKDYQLVQKENALMKTELQRQTLEIENKNKELQVLGEQIDVSRMGVSGWTGEEKKLLELRIDHYLKEIEKCLSLLNA